MRICVTAGLNVRVGILLRRSSGRPTIELPDGETAEPGTGARAAAAASVLDGFDPCIVLLNNDLSAGMPEHPEEPDEQYLLPPLHAGWSVRRKSQPLRRLRRGVPRRFAACSASTPG